MSVARAGLDYARRGRVAVATPQANPTVEDEFRILLPPTIGINVVRLRAQGTPQARLAAFAETVSDSLASLDALKPQVMGFACTGTSYMIGREAEARRFDAVSGEAGYPVITAAAAIRWALERWGARRIALVAPYPEWLLEAGRRYWTEVGFDVASVTRVQTGSEDTRSIYGLTSRQAAATLQDLDVSGVDAVLVSGTGMPVLPALAEMSLAKPIVASNAALAARLMVEIGAPGVSDDLEITGWRDRLAEAAAD